MRGFIVSLHNNISGNRLMNNIEISLTRVALLLERGASASAVANNGNTPVHAAVGDIIGNRESTERLALLQSNSQHEWPTAFLWK